MNPAPPLQPDEDYKEIAEIIYGVDEAEKLIKAKAHLPQVEAVFRVLEAREQAARIVSRFEVIDHTESGTGRQFVKWLSYDFKVEFDLQDDGRTLKVFLTDIPFNKE